MESQQIEHGVSLMKMIPVASIAAGVQFGWALQLSLLTPYVQLLGIPHKYAAFIWLCGPISGMIVQPLVGHYSDRCRSKFGRRRPFILSGAILVAVAVFLIGFAADFGIILGDSLTDEIKIRAISIFIVGFWVLDVANNMLQGPCRALLSDLSGDDNKKTRVAFTLFSFFMAVGNVAGYAAGAYTHLHKMLPFTATAACDVYCANLKTCFIISICLLMTLTIIAVTTNTEAPYAPPEKTPETQPEKKTAIGELAGAIKGLPKPMWILMLVTALTWIAWFPFLLFDTDWMGKEVYGGVAGGVAGKGKLYDDGVRAGALGLMINSIVLGFASLSVEGIGNLVGGVKKLWGYVNFILAIALAATIWVTKMAESNRHFGADGIPLPPIMSVKIGALALFAILGIPLAVTFSIPFALASIYSKDTGAGQGLSLGVLNLAIVIPQMFVSVVSGPLDAAFGGGNLPAFVMGAIAATVSGLIAIFMLPSPPPDRTMGLSVVGGGH